MKKTLLPMLMMLTLHSQAQKFMTKTGSIEFNATSSIEKIEGKNKSVACLLDSKTGDLNFIVQIKSFVFAQQLMQEHFNENYMESDKFPAARFKGKITNLSTIDFSKNGEYNADVAGVMTLHGVTKEIKSSGKIKINDSKITLNATFSVLLSDYNISIPGAVKDKISKDAKINVNCVLDQMK